MFHNAIYYVYVLLIKILLHFTISEESGKVQTRTSFSIYCSLSADECYTRAGGH